MKALMKLAGAAKFFQKVERKKDVVTDDEVLFSTTQRLFQLEQVSLAEQIGIDQQEIIGMRWFFDQTRLMKLPGHWRRQLADGEVRYLNDATGEQSKVHPNLELLKVFFYDRLANDQASATFADKSRKLLPHIEQKLTKEMIGLSSKRKDAEKVNMKRDENGKVVTSKTERIAPDTTKLIASRNYLLKSIVDKVVTKSELWGYGKRARQYAILLDKTKNSKAALLEEEEEVETLELMDRIYTEAFEFYDSEYGQLTPNADKLDEKILKLLTPETVVMCLNLLNVEKQQIEHFWFGRLMNCLLLPPMWRRHKGKSFDEFVYEPKNLTFDLHPCFIYMLNQRNRFQLQYEQMPLAQQEYYLSFRQMEFVDFFQRTFQVDMYALMEASERQLQKANRLSQSVNDWMLVEGLVEADVPQESYILAEQVEVFWRKRNFAEENYTPSVSPYGEVLWSHNITGSCLERCPYKTELERFLAPICREIPPIEPRDYKPIYEQLNQYEGFEKLFLQANLNEKICYLQHYVEGQRNTPYQIPESYSAESYFDSIFSCPFNFEREINLTADTTPLWIEICRADKLSRILKQVVLQLTDQNAIDQYYNIVKKHYLDDTLRFEPENLDTVRSTLTDSIQKDQLLRLIDYVFDVRKREERLGRNKPPPEPESQRKEEQDIFGSQQSQIDLNQYEPNETDEDYPILPPDKAALIRQGEAEQDNEMLDDFEDNYERKEEASNEYSQTEKSEENKSPLLTEEQLPSHELESEEVMNNKINMARKKSLKVHKFNRASKIQTNEIVDRVNKIANTDDRLRSKRDLLLSNLKREQLPTKHNILRSPVKPTHVISQQSASESVSISMFNSVLSNYTNASVVDLIRKLPPKPIQPPPPVNIVQESPSPIKLIKVMDTEENETEESVLELAPIVQDSIRDDPVLRHISNFKEISDFTIAFGLSRTSTAEPESREMSRHILPSRLDEMDRQTIHSSQRLLRATSVMQKPAPNRIRKADLPEKKTMEVTASNFRRRCVSSTASHLLNCNAVTSRLTFSKIEIRKDLYLRSRGIFGDFLHQATPH